ncbi:hypothetical protein SAMN05443661_10463 [Natronobacterium gregoryi]|uniref:Uncharacterized protein n=1 Tax=Natronobacterium gregoryi TaxID=44930 RepID=A0A1I3KHI2_9EURY|nr:hypothetical protein SAMN05443661_10463 [Natronobacterium gregoryi]
MLTALLVLELIDEPILRVDAAKLRKQFRE